ncbi:MAG TPA: PDZ domain-containing protein, partial [Candidatus Acidoferrum sp.]|nr:PDZ domain-containing protein [Candidatus Acidoferrum sp.]
KLVYAPAMTDLQKLMAGRRHALDARYSLGITASSDGTVTDVVAGSPAYNAHVGPGDKIVAVNSRSLTKGQSQLDDALKAAEHGAGVRLLLSGGDVYREVTIDYHGGPRFPRLQRVEGSADVLGTIAKPLTVTGTSS